jgi:hypothetical protein
MTLTRTRPATSSSRAAPTRTVPIRVWEKSTLSLSFEALVRTTKVVPREVEQRAVPRMKASREAVGSSMVNNNLNVLLLIGEDGGGGRTVVEARVDEGE